MEPGPPFRRRPIACWDARLAALQAVRAFLPEVWVRAHARYILYGQRFFLNKRSSIPDPSSTGLCRHTTLFLQRLLRSAGDDSWEVKGGRIAAATKELPSGCPVEDRGGEWNVDADGRFWGQHWWLEDGHRILDLTADSFGHDRVVLVAITDPRYRRLPDLCRQDVVSRLAGTVVQWEGTATTWGMQASGELDGIRDRYVRLRDGFVAAWRDGLMPAPSGGAPPEHQVAARV